MHLKASTILTARRALMALPAPTRGWVVGHLPVRGLAHEMRANVAHDATYWERFYGTGPDPFGFDSSANEAAKFERTIEVCGPGPLGRVLELGASVGTFTELIARRCDHLLAIDISETAVRRARVRLAGFDNVTCETRVLPADLPSGPFDLIIASDVLYYWPMEDLLDTLPRLVAALAPGGALVAVHYVPPMGAILSGGEVHDALDESLPLRRTVADRVEFGAGRPYRVARYEKT